MRGGPLSSSDPSADRSFERVPLRGLCYERDCSIGDLLIRLIARWRNARECHCVGGVLCPRSTDRLIRLASRWRATGSKVSLEPPDPVAARQKASRVDV